TNGFAYFGTGTSPGIVVKVQLSDFTRAGALTLETGENSLNSATIDTTNGFAYFGTGTSPGIVVKVQLSDFTRAGALTLETGENVVRSATIDTTNGFAYFGLETDPGIVVKVQLSDFTRVGALTFESGESYANSATIDTTNGFAYFGTITIPGIVVKVQLSDFTRVGALTSETGENNLYSALIDTTNGFAYFSTETYPGKVVKVQLSDTNPTPRLGTAGSQTLTVNGNLTLGDGIATVTVDGDNFDPVIDIGGNLVIQASATLISSDTSAFNVGGSWTNSGIFTPQSGTVTLNGTNQAVLGSTTFYNLRKTDPDNDSTDLTLTFDNTATQTITNLLTLTGIDTNDRVNLVSDSPGTQWSLTANGTFSIDWAEVTDSDASGGSQVTQTNTEDGGNNLNWLLGIDVSGTVYTDEGSTNIGTGKTVALSVNGGTTADTDLFTGETDSNGDYTITVTTIPSAGDTIAVFLDDETQNGTTVTVSDGEALSNLDIYQDHVITRHDNSGSLTNTLLNTADNADTDIDYSVTDSNLTVGATNEVELYIPASHTFLPGGTVTTGDSDTQSDLKIVGTLNMAGNDLTIAGNYTNSGTYTSGANTTIFNGAGNQTLITGGTGDTQDFNNITVNKASGSLTTSTNAVDIDGTLTVSSGTLTIDKNTTVTGNITNAGTITENDGYIIKVAVSTALDKAFYSEGVDTTLDVTVIDQDENLDGTSPDTTTVTITYNADSETVTLTETGNATGVFTGSLSIERGDTPTSDDSILEISANGTITASYTDSEDSTDNNTSDTAPYSTRGVGSGGGSGGGIFPSTPQATSTPLPQVTPTQTPTSTSTPTVTPTPTSSTPDSNPPLPLIPETIETAKDILETVGETIEDVVFKDFPSDLLNLTKNFSELRDTLTEIGITTYEDIKRLAKADIHLPSFEDISTIPTDIVFARSGDKLINYNTRLRITEKGEVTQLIYTISGQTLNLAIKPQGEVDKVTGRIVIKDISQSKQQETVFLPGSTITANILLSNNSFTQKKDINIKYMLQEFKYTDPDKDGIYTAVVIVPLVAGDFEVITTFDYKDGTKEELALFTLVVDPEGYIYTKSGDNEVRLPNAKIAIYYRQVDTQNYVIWPGEDYQQINPQFTDNTGEYSFLVPEGEYYLKVEIDGYKEYVSEPFIVYQGQGIHENIEMKKTGIGLSVEVAMLGVLILLVLYFHLVKRKKVKFRSEYSSRKGREMR
ncbi:MAG: hypothetical protein ABH833_03190, partial [Parcubacteria group bacterium]